MNSSGVYLQFIVPSLLFLKCSKAAWEQGIDNIDIIETAILCIFEERLTFFLLPNTSEALKIFSKKIERVEQNQTFYHRITFLKQLWTKNLDGRYTAGSFGQKRFWVSKIVTTNAVASYTFRNF